MEVRYQSDRSRPSPVLGVESECSPHRRANRQKAASGARNYRGKFFISFLPAVSDKAAKKIRGEVRSWKLQLRSDKTLSDLGRRRGKIVRTEKAQKRFKERVQEITSRSRGVSMPRLLTELRRYAVGWMNYFGLNQAYRIVPELDQWLRRRVRMCYWKQWKRARPRRRNLIRLGIHPREVHKATRSHRGYWFMAGTSIVQRALTNQWLAERGVPNLTQQWVEMHYGKQNPKFDPASVNLTGTA